MSPRRVDRPVRSGAAVGPRTRVIAAAPLLALALACAAGCGGSPSPPVARIGTTTGTGAAPGSYEQARIRWAECIRRHGVPSLPDPNSEGEVNLAGIDIRSPQFLAAHQACRALEVANPPAVVQRQIKQELAVAECMRRHGVSDFPDPDSRGQIPQTAAANWQTWSSSPVGSKAEKIL